MIIEQFSQLASSSREPSTFPSQSEVNPKGHASSSSGGNPNEPLRKVTTVISLGSGREINNQVGNSSETYKYPHSFFQNSSPSSSYREIGLPSNSRDGIDGILNDITNLLPSGSPSDKKEHTKKDSGFFICSGLFFAFFC